MDPNELYLFYQKLVRTLRDRGVVCAITSGLACVHYGVAETTKDCDLLCNPASFRELFELLKTTQVQGAACHYRGNISPPLDARWHGGGWTSHFEWMSGPEAVTLDVFGRALRETSPWEEELVGLYAGPQTVAEMKRTNRDKDWAPVTALGVRMIEADDERGWLHIYDADVLAELLREYSCPPHVAQKRPALQLGLANDPRTAGALNAERKFWEVLDRRRILIFEHHLRPYISAVRKAHSDKELSLEEDHILRLECATRYLPATPLEQYGLDRYISEAKEELVTSGLLPESALTWLPDVTFYFQGLD